MPQRKKPRPEAAVIREDARANLGEHYSEKAVDHMLRPRNMAPSAGPMATPERRAGTARP